MANGRHAQIKVSGAPSLRLRSMRGRESLGRLFEIEVDLWSVDAQLAHDQVVGKSATVTLLLPSSGGKARYFTGVINRFEQTGYEGSFAFYRATLVPWTWFLTRVSDCRVLEQNKTAVDHIKKILTEGDIGMGAATPKLQASDYRSREFCVQYNETSFNFISRLMEEEGIYYFFKHQQNGHHDMLLMDGPACHEPAEFNIGEVGFRNPGQGEPEKGWVRSWVLETRTQSETYTLADFDPMNPAPRPPQIAMSETSLTPGNPELYEYPGEYVTEDEGLKYATVRLEALAAQHKVVRGTTDHPFFAAGMRFNFKPGDKLYRSDQSKDYLIVSASYEVHVPPAASGEPGSTGPAWACSFTAIDARTPYRTPRTTAKPVVQGPQTAIVTGKSGNEIDADEHGRVTVQFHWDREGKSDEKSSCRVRVAQQWAGKGWGYLFTPRIGQEVIVEFLEGDPDRPLITGRVYNGENKPPYDPKQYPTMSVIKSSSSPGGEGFNELRFEDKKGSEMIWIHAQKRMDIRVRGNFRETNYGNRDVRVGWEKDGESGGSYNILVKEDVNEWVKKGVYEKVEKMHHRVVLEDVIEDYQKNQYTFVKETLQLNAAKIVCEGKDLFSAKAGKVLVEGSKDGVHIKSGAAMKLQANGNVSLLAGSKLVGEGQSGVSLKGMSVVIEGTTSVVMKVGGNFVSIGPAGVDITGALVNINSGGSAGGPADSGEAADAAEGAAAQSISEPLEPAIADDGKPGKVSKGGGGSRTRPSRTVDPQQAPDSPPFPPPPAPWTPPPPPPPPPPSTTDDEWEIAELVECYESAGTTTQAASGRARQFVNYDRSGTGNWDLGRTIYLKAKLRWKSGDASRSLAGKKVYWKAAPDGANKTGLVAALKGGFGGTADKMTEESTVDDQGWTPVVSFLLTRYGGDKFKFQAASDSGYANKLESGEYIVWRKLLYELDGMVRPGGGSYKDKFDASILDNRFNGQFVELGTTGTDNAPAHQRVVTETEVGTWSAACRDGVGGSRYFHLVFIDTIAWDPATDTVNRTLTPGGSIAFDPASWTLDPRDYLVSVRWRQPVGSGSWTALDNGRVTLSDGPNSAGAERQWLDFDFSGTAADTTQDIELELRIKHYDEGSGLQSGAATIVGMRWRERDFSGAQLTARTMRTAIHEPAHRMGLASKKLPNGSNNTDFYSNAGGHCHALSDGCVMYGINDKDATNFCPNCADALRGSDLANLPQDGRNDLF